MSTWQGNLLIGSIGLGLAVAVLFVLLRLWRRQPIASYRLVCAVLVATLLLPAGQLALNATGLSRSLPFFGALVAGPEPLAPDVPRGALLLRARVEPEAIAPIDPDANELAAWTGSASDLDFLVDVALLEEIAG